MYYFFLIQGLNSSVCKYVDIDIYKSLLYTTSYIPFNTHKCRVADPDPECEPDPDKVLAV